MRILGIETSCDETAAAVVEDGRMLLSNVVQSQIDIHKEYGGVVPEIAARSHLEGMVPVVEKALEDAFSGTGVQELGTGKKDFWDQIDAIAVTYAPGLAGSLLIGTLAARVLARLKDKPLYLIHHVEGHVYANFLVGAGVQESGTRDNATNLPSIFPSSQPLFPALALIVSGGHSQLVLFRDHGDYTLLGQTQDDAVGEAFDKVAKIIGLPYPGGPSVAEAALTGDPHAFKLPKAKFTCVHGGEHFGIRDKAAACHRYDFSFSGLKTAVLRAIQNHAGVGHNFPSYQLHERLDNATRANMAASFQRVAIETLVDKTELAFNEYKPASVVIAGGVAANQELRRQLSERLPIGIEYPDVSLCTDNAAMIATLGYYEARRKPAADPLDVEIVPSLSM